MTTTHLPADIVDALPPVECAEPPTPGTAVAMPATRLRVRAAADAGLATAEYAVATLAAVAFAGLLATVLRSGVVKQLLIDIVTKALS